MRRASLAVLLSAFLLASETCFGLTIARDGKAQAIIVVDPSAPPAQAFAASELRDFLTQVTGATFSIATKRNLSQTNLLVGTAAAKSVDPAFATEALGNDGIVIRTVGNDLILAGGEPRGTLYAVYGFLEDQVGCHWWTPTVSTIPKKSTLEIGELNVRYVPPLEYRETDNPDALDGAWSARNHFNGSYHELDATHGGKISYIAQNKWSCHTFWTLIPPEIYFKDHPEWYSLIGGERRCSPNEHAMLCTSNEDMRRELVKNVRLALTWHPNANMMSISQIDDAGPPEHCECDKCAAIEKEEGSYSGNMIRFVNACAEDLEKDYPNLIIDTLAYHYTQKPPLLTKPRHNVVVRLCDIHCSFSVPLSDDRNHEFRDDLVGWSKICNRLYIWDYVGNFSYPMLPHPNLRTIGPNVRFLIAHGVKGMFGESPVLKSQTMAPLRNWLLGQIYWNPQKDEHELIEEFCNGYFGAGGKDVLAYVDTIQDAVEASGDELGLGSPANAKFLSFATLDKGWSELSAAEKAVNGSPDLVKRVRAEQIAVVYAVILNWQRCHDQAKQGNATWPWPDNLSTVVQDFKARMAEQSISLDGVSLPDMSGGK